MKKIGTIIFPVFLLLSGCASMMPKDALTQEVISEPKPIFAETKAKMDNVAKYDDSGCYQFPTAVKSFSMFERMSPTEFVGKIDGHWSGTEYVWVKGPYKNFFPWIKEGDPGWHPSYRGTANGDTHCLTAFGCNWDFPEKMCVKKHGSALSKEQKYWRGQDVNVIELITRRKLTENERKELLKKEQKELDEEYNKYNKSYQEILQKWKTENSALTFCNDIKTEWMENECRFPISTYECANLATPFVECYKQGFIKLSPEYLKAIS